jgi:hypothetical protein
VTAMSDPFVAEAHAWIAGATAAAAVVVGILAVGAAATHGSPARWRLWLDRAVLALLVLVVIAAVAGVVVLAVVAPPADWLHLVYAGVALVAVPAARGIARSRRSSRLGLWMFAGSLVTLGALLRLWMTGG